MLTTPVFGPWRPLWDSALGAGTRRIDELANERRKGRHLPPRVSADVLQLMRRESVQKLLHGAGRTAPAPEFLCVMAELAPLLRACAWPRWLLLEAALEQASLSGALHLAALVLRTQIEELDALRHVAAVLAPFTADAWDAESVAAQIIRALGLGDGASTSTWDEESVSAAIKTLSVRVLPRLQTKTAEELVETAADVAGAVRRPERLHRAFDELGDYVHPNYGSHVLSVRPHSPEAARALVDAFVAVYEDFLSLPWAREGDDADPGGGAPRADDWQKQALLRKVNPPFLVLAEETARALAPAHPFAAELGAVPWIDAINCFHRKLERDSHQEASARFFESDKAGKALATEAAPEINGDVKAIRALREHSDSVAGWPEPLNTAAGRLEYARLVGVEEQLVEDAERVGTDSRQRDEGAWLSLLLSGLTFSINVTEFKLGALARHAASLINDENVLGATLVVRSMLEHHAVAIELGAKLRSLWDRAQKGAPSSQQVISALAEAEKQIARVLAASSGSRETAAAWRTVWEQTARKHYNVLEPIRALDAKAPGFLKTYGLLSHVVHGTVCTGGDLVRTHEGKNRVGRHTLAQLALNLARLIEVDAMMDRQASAMEIAGRLDQVRRDPQGAAAALKSMRIGEGQKLKHGRDIFGSGTEAAPYRFRRGLVYEEAYYHWLDQERIQVRARWTDTFAGGVGDRVETEDGRTLYFLHDTLPKPD